MENTLGIIGTILGAAGLVLSVYVVRWQTKWQSKELERTNRLIFLQDRIFDISIPRNLRLPFYEEYLSMKGNGTAVKFWLTEEQNLKIG